MSRYIDADELLELYDINDLKEDVNWKIPIEVVKQNIKDMPIADVVKVVRCKTCKYAMTQDCPMDEVYADDYCSYGERKEPGDE